MTTIPSKAEMTAAILQAKQRLGLKWAAIAQAAGLSPVFVTSACLGMNSLAKAPADQLAAALELGPEISAALQEFPHKHWPEAIPTDPVVYRFYEMIH
ncbi:MAG: cyanate hydratase, partial [Verrucomicrobia bacterium]|nr:cyanate hydratase [Verrucomicrobiota bacterium]